MMGNGCDKERCRTYSAYCMAPSFFSWLGRGTSRLGLPVAVRGGPWASCDLVIAVAGLDDVEEMEAAGPSRERRSEVGGLAVGCSLALVARVLVKGQLYIAKPTRL